MMVGVGGDLFAIIYTSKDRKIHVLNASGTAPTGATVAHFNELGYHWDARNWGPMSGMPVHGILPVTVPGAAWGWQEVLKRFGTMNFQQVLEPAVQYADGGFPVSERIASDWHLPNALPLKGCCTEPDPDSIKTWYLNGNPPKPGAIFKNPELARTFRLLQTQGADAFYRGEIAKAIVAKSQALGGTMTLEDLANYHGEWVEGARSRYHGYDVIELPPPAQAWAANEMLGILQGCVPHWAPGKTLASLGPANPEYWHLLCQRQSEFPIGDNLNSPL
jgi:gamma-glutamyltranspeptidase/glutathione hydrolase